MNEIDHAANHDKFAPFYDEQVKEFNSYGHDALFGMCFEYIKSGESLLDLGIGTGLSSIHFARIGLEISGIDASTGMLAECRKKNFAKELKQYDVTKVPLPYPDQSFQHVISCGLFHFLGNLQLVFQDVSRIIKSGGIFAFSCSLPAGLPENAEDYPEYLEVPTAWGINIYQHTDHYIEKISQTNNFKILKQQKLLVNSGDPNAADLLFKIFVLRRS